MRQAVIVSAARIATGRFLGGLSSLSATDLGGIAVKAAVRRAGIDPETIDEAIMGNVVSGGLGQAPARQASIKAGLPATIPALTVNKVCGSGLKAVMLAAQAIRAGDGRVFVAGGMESMSNAPYFLPKARSGYRMGNGELVDSVVHDGLWCAVEDWHMGLAAELIAERFEVSREQMDEFSFESHRKAVEAAQAGRFKEQIVPVEIPQRKGTLRVEADETPRPDANLDAMRKLAPAFKAGGRVTAGNAPGLSDGAAALVVMDEDEARRLGVSPLARITGYASASLEPKWLFAAPPYAVRKLLALTGARIEDFDLLEVNEAFSSQILANGKELGWDWKKVNVNGGAVALGHPIGASGARILTTLIYALRDRGGGKGMAALCLGGGGAVALSIETC